MGGRVGGWWEEGGKRRRCKRMTMRRRKKGDNISISCSEFASGGNVLRQLCLRDHRLGYW